MKIIISLNIKRIELVEIAVFNERRIEHLTLVDKEYIDTNMLSIKLINNSSKGNFIAIILYYHFL